MYTLATKDYIHNFLFLEFISRKITFQSQELIFRELISRKLHITCSFVIQRITWKNCLGIISWKISFQLHEIYFSEFRRQKIPSTSTERQKRSQNLAPVLVIISGNSLVFSRKMITSTGSYRCCAAGTSAPVVVKIQSPRIHFAVISGWSVCLFRRNLLLAKLGCESACARFSRRWLGSKGFFFFWSH